MPPRARRGSIALSMLDQSVAPNLKSVISNVIPPSEDATLQVVDSLVTAAVWTTHCHTLDEIARICAADMASVEMMRGLALSNEFLGKDDGECGLRLTDPKDGEPLAFDIDVLARGRIETQAQSVSPAAAAAAIKETFSDFDEEQVPGKGGRGVLDDAPLLTALTVRSPPTTMTMISQSAGRMVTPRSSEVSSSSSRAKSIVSPAMMLLFNMADRRGVGWLNVFLEYHGQKKWASPSTIRSILVDLGISKSGNDPVKPNLFARRDFCYSFPSADGVGKIKLNLTTHSQAFSHKFLLSLMQRDPLVDFTCRPLPPDELVAAVEHQARELAAILKEAEGGGREKPAVARRRLNRALTSTAGGGVLHPPNSAPARTFGAGGGMEGVDEEDARDRSSREGWDRSGHQVTLEVAVRDLAASRRRSTSAPAARDIRGRHKSNAGQKTRRGGRGPFGGGGTLGGGGSGGGGGGGGGGKGHDGVPRAGKGLEAFLTLDHSVQASLVEAGIDIRPGVTVQESAIPDEGGSNGSRSTAEVLRSRSGPAEMPNPPKKLGRQQQQALLGKGTAPDIPSVGLGEFPWGEGAERKIRVDGRRPLLLWD
eukprot:jgi/Undpi1/6768/HiC_scaffold_21.g09247.m1